MKIKKQSLTDGKIILRPLDRQDEVPLYEAVRETLDDLMPWLPFCRHDYSIKETRIWLKGRDEEWQMGISYDFAIIDAVSGDLMGVGGINHVIDEFKMANLGYWIRKSCMGRGIAVAAVRLLAAFGFDELGLNRIEIIPDVRNKRSQRVAEKSGAKREGILRKRLTVNGQVSDAVMYSLTAEDVGRG
ncbi:MAG TPA: GNAT family N-acetyltransferase [Dehalococcoidia bacterium]|nr:GNAT family N-acetyltransferase [Dehalococcoidia bacterium]